MAQNTITAKQCMQCNARLPRATEPLPQLKLHTERFLNQKKQRRFIPRLVPLSSFGDTDRGLDVDCREYTKLIAAIFSLTRNKT